MKPTKSFEKLLNDPSMDSETPSEIHISWVDNASSVETHDCAATKMLEVVRTGGKELRGKVEALRQAIQLELGRHGDYNEAKKATSELKKRLPAVIWSGTFIKRDNASLVKHSGLLCADLDSVGERLSETRRNLVTSPHLFALFLSPSGDGLKAVFRVPADASKHAASFLTIEKHLPELTGFDIDQACKDVARLCFLAYDPEIYINENAVEIEPFPEVEKPTRIHPNGIPNVSERQRIAIELLGQVDWQSETSGFLQCPGKHLHITGDAERDCRVVLDGAPTVHCFHDHCRGIIDAINQELRSRIGRVEYAANNSGLR